jgi:hypothetical protein
MIMNLKEEAKAQGCCRASGKKIPAESGHLQDYEG